MSMLNRKSLKPLLPLAVGLLAFPACSLSAPKGTMSAGGASGDMDTCPMPNGGALGGAGGSGAGENMSEVDAGAGASDAGSNANTIVTPVSCAGVGPRPNAIDKYSQGYTQDPEVLKKVDTTMATLSLKDEIAQMIGLRITPNYHPTNNIQRSEDTATIRGFRYRDASRGVDLGEDFSGTYPKAGKDGTSDVGYSTAFPVSMARGAAFDMDLEYAIGEAIGDEMQAAKETVMLAPCMNLLRHPLWGRAQETYGEDSFHVGRLASALAVGIQEHILANAKHYLAYDIENNRETNNSVMDEQTLREVYGRHFRMVAQDSGVGSFMAAYNLVNGTKATQSKHLLTDVLRDDFGFKGFVLSDWWAMPNGYNPAEVDATSTRRAAIDAVKAGLDIELPWGFNFGQLESIVNSNGGLTKADLDPAVRRVLEQKYRFKSDKLDGNVGLTPSTATRYRKFEMQCNDSHIQLAERAALESMVLLKNDKQTLPIKAATKVAVLAATVPFQVTDGATDSDGKNVRKLNFATGELLDDKGASRALTGDLGSSRVFHNPKKQVTPLDGIKAAAPVGVTVVSGETVDVAKDADFIVVMAGLTPQDEGEAYTHAGDRTSLLLDAKQSGAYANIQNNLITAAAALGKPMVVVLEGGSVIQMPWLDAVPSVVMAFYPGMVGGSALGKLLFGNVGGTDYNFSGKLPFTWGKRLEDYQTFNGAPGQKVGGDTTFDYFVGYHYFDDRKIEPQFPFGYGLSYTKFEYKKLQLGCSDMSKGAVLPVVVNVANTGTAAGDETVMVFVSFPGTKARRPLKELKGFARVSLKPGEEKQVTIPVRLIDLDYFQTDPGSPTTGKWVVEAGDVNIMVGGSSTNLPLTGKVTVKEGFSNASSAALR